MLTCDPGPDEAPDELGKAPDELEGQPGPRTARERSFRRVSLGSSLELPPERPGSGRLLLALALLLGLLRFVRLGEWGLWVDEAFTVNDVHRLLAGEGELFRGNALGLATIAAWVRLLGHWPSEAELRFLPACAGFLGIALTYWAFHPLAGRRRAAAAALFVAASSWHLYWSQNARFYTFAQDLGLVCSGLVVRAYARDRARLAVCAAFVGALAALAHLSGGLIPLAIWVASWIVAAPVRGGQRATARPLVALTVAGAGAGLLALPWIWNIWSEYRAAQVGKGAFEVGLGAIGHMALTTGYYVSPVLGAAALGGALLGRRRLLDRLAIGVVGVVAVIVIVAGTQTRVTAQYVFVLLPWIALLAARPLDAAFGLRAPALAWLVLAIVAASGLTQQGLYFTVHQGARPRWREAYEYVWSARGPDDLVIGMCPPVGDYYLSPGDTRTRVPNRITRMDPYNPEPPLQWARYGKRIWLVLSHEWLEDWWTEDRRRMREFLVENCRLVRHLPLNVETRDLGVWIYRYDGE